MSPLIETLDYPQCLAAARLEARRPMDGVQVSRLLLGRNSSSRSLDQF